LAPAADDPGNHNERRRDDSPPVTVYRCHLVKPLLVIPDFVAFLFEAATIRMSAAMTA
jgi:hypothetical protein